MGLEERDTGDGCVKYVDPMDTRGTVFAAACSLQGAWHENEDRFNCQKIKNLNQLSQKEIIDALRNSIKALSDEVDKIGAGESEESSGTTFVVSVVSRGNVYTANVGDSVVVMISKEGRAIKCRQLTQHEHNIENIQHEDQERIQKAGGEIAFYQGNIPSVRYNGYLIQLTHSLGDGFFQEFISHEPSVEVNEIPGEKDLYLAVMSDGITYRPQSEGVGIGTFPKRDSVMTTALREKELSFSLEGIAETLCQSAKNSISVGYRYGITQPSEDDITVVIARCEEGVMVLVADGHGEHSGAVAKAEYAVLSFPAIFQKCVDTCLTEKERAVEPLAYYRDVLGLYGR